MKSHCVQVWCKKKFMRINFFGHLGGRILNRVAPDVSDEKKETRQKDKETRIMDVPMGSNGFP